MIKRILSGLEIGSFIFLLISLFSKETFINTETILFVLSLSGVVGAVTVVFDLDTLNFLTALLIHFCVIVAYITLFNVIFQLDFSIPTLLLSTFVIYIISYFVVYVHLLIMTTNLNKLIKKSGKVR
ncbi:hypothetical protein B2D45_06140 [Lactobacillus hilgardii]